MIYICSPCEETENTDPVPEVIPEIDERAKQAELLDEIMIGGDSGEEEEYSKYIFIFAVLVKRLRTLILYRK